jgi:hypothetical protein
MAARSVRVWFDQEGDFLEVLFDSATPGYFRETDDDRVMEKVDEQGNVLGFSVLGVSDSRFTAPLQFVLPSRGARA